MALTGKLKVYRLSRGTKVVRVWKDLELSKTVTGAASRLILMDTKGEIPANVLCDWLSEVEARRKEWEEREQ